jgi:hypothetical protein
MNFCRHPEPRSAFRRRSSAIDFPQTGTRRSSLAFRKNEQINVDNTRRMSLLELKPNGESNKNLKNLVVKVSLFKCFFHKIKFLF